MNQSINAGFCLCAAFGALCRKPLCKNKEFILRTTPGLVETLTWLWAGLVSENRIVK